MNSIFLIAVATIGCASVSFATDHPSPKTATLPPPPPAVKWEGFYVGAQGGWQDFRNSFSDIGIGASIGDDTFATRRRNSFIGGAKAGYDMSFHNVVYGIVADVDAGHSGNRYWNPNGWGFSQKLRVQGSLRARAGISFGDALFYATAGITGAKFSTAYYEGTDPNPLFNFPDNKVGWTVGAGFEYMMDNNWSALLEYRYSDYGRIVNQAPNPWTNYTDTHRMTTNTVRVGINYRFGQQ